MPASPNASGSSPGCMGPHVAPCAPCTRCMRPHAAVCVLNAARRTRSAFTLHADACSGAPAAHLAPPAVSRPGLQPQAAPCSRVRTACTRSRCTCAVHVRMQQLPLEFTPGIDGKAISRIQPRHNLLSGGVTRERPGLRGRHHLELDGALFDRYAALRVLCAGVALAAMTGGSAAAHVRGGGAWGRVAGERVVGEGAAGIVCCGVASSVQQWPRAMQQCASAARPPGGWRARCALETPQPLLCCRPNL